jgi:protein-tyrosine kinase
MSRIEEALEKATKMREEKSPTEQTVKSRSMTGEPEIPKVEESLRIENPYLVAATQPQSPISEEYRKLKSLLLKLTKVDNFLNTLMVTSSIKGEGKSLTAMNLAITLAEEYDHTVLMVDADLRQPSMHKYLDIEPKVGLSDCLMNNADVSDALIKTGIGKLVFLPSGSEISNPAELLASNRMKDLIRELKKRYSDRYVIFDTPPILPFAEAHSIGSLVDGILLVAREGFTSLDNLKETIHLLKGANILGIVYNGVEIDRFDGHYYYHYYKSYYSRNKNEYEGTNGKEGWLPFFRRGKK